MNNDPYPYQPGDILLYAPSGVFGWLIAIKTWNKVSHVETYLGNGLSAASRDGIGVATYPVRTNGLVMVRRPIRDLNMEAALAWHNQCIGQKYDWKGILVFTLAVKNGSKDKMFCSEHATRFARQGGLEPFSRDYDADRVAPANFLTSGAYYTQWSCFNSPPNQ